ncbi:unnamed protein product [Linum tenue]|uniref:F-box domain-containing protein n=1 Tax=Linum tenue TaxID=586396 RepID=A0AAV0JRR6_9ROSI|nr:unnamed protein product [Linum tenue]
MFRLHPRIACRCKLVCQLWRSVISAASFNRLLVSRLQTMSPNDLKLMVLSFIPPMPNGVEDRDALKVLDCDRDLVLCGFWDTENMDKKHGRAYLVCNPFTKQWNALPLAPRKLAAYHSSVSRSGWLHRVQCSSGSRFTFDYSSIDPLSELQRLFTFLWVTVANTGLNQQITQLSWTWMSSNQNYDKQEQTDKEVKIISETLQQAVVAVTENQARNHSGRETKSAALNSRIL